MVYVSKHNTLIAADHHRLGAGTRKPSLVHNFAWTHRAIGLLLHFLGSMASSDESGPNDIVSERETQFIPRSDDDEVLWDVQEITAERGKKYKVKWVGIDPATRKPWAQSWVAKHDCTDKLVAEWKAKRKKLAAGKKRGEWSFPP